MRARQKEIDNHAIDVMVNGGRHLCDDAIAKWSRGTYSKNQKAINDNVARWKRIRAAIGDMRTPLRAHVERQSRVKESTDTCRD